MENDACKEGRRAYQVNPQVFNNPYPAVSQLHNDFERGWVQELKKSAARSTPGEDRSCFALQVAAQRFPVAFVNAYVDSTEEKQKAARAYAKATGRE